MRGSRAGSDEAAAAGAFCAWLACREFREVASEAVFSSRDRERDVAEEVTLAAYGGKQVFVGWIREESTISSAWASPPASQRVADAHAYHDSLSRMMHVVG